MEFGISLLAAIPQRIEPSDKSEMVNQILFGEAYSILNEDKDWYHIVTKLDGYRGFIHKKQHTPITDKEFIHFYEKGIYVTLKEHNIILSDKTHIKLSPGSIFPDIERLMGIFNKNWLTLEKEKIFVQGDSSDYQALDKLLNLFQNVPYLWGGKTLYGIDCSAFTQIAYRILGENIPRDSRDQYLMGENVSNISEIKKGDLAFFTREKETISHVGILLGNQKIIHASGKVRIDGFDNNGIYNEELKQYTHKLFGIKRLI